MGQLNARRRWVSAQDDMHGGGQVRVRVRAIGKERKSETERKNAKESESTGEQRAQKRSETRQSIKSADSRQSQS